MSLVWGLLLQRMLLEVCCHSNLAGGKQDALRLCYAQLIFCEVWRVGQWV